MAKVILYPQDHEIPVLNDQAQSQYCALKARAALITRQGLERQGRIEIAPANGQAKQVGRKTTLDNTIDNRSLAESSMESSEGLT